MRERIAVPADDPGYTRWRRSLPWIGGTYSWIALCAALIAVNTSDSYATTVTALAVIHASAFAVTVFLLLSSIVLAPSGSSPAANGWFALIWLLVATLYATAWAAYSIQAAGVIRETLAIPGLEFAWFVTGIAALSLVVVASVINHREESNARRYF